MHRTGLRRLVPVLLACGSLLAACADVAVSAPAASAARELGTRRLDSLVTAEALFPDAAQRRLYRVLPPVTDQARRSYAFQLLPQPGMDPVRHFHLITVTWVPAGQLSKAPGICAAGVGTGGPGGGFVDACVQTADRAWDVRVTLGSLLPAGVQVPDFDVAAAADGLLRRYQER
jgi:hypothetical protein